jgi:hypothetical protein
MTQTYSSQFGGDLVSEALSDSSLSWGIWQDPPKFHDGYQFHHGKEHTAYNVIVDDYEDEDDYVD